MSTGVGHLTQIGFGEQLTYDTAVVRTKGLRAIEEGLGLKQTVQQKTVLGRVSQHINIKGKRGVEGPIKTYLHPDGVELLLKHAFGAIASEEGELDGGGNYYTHTFTLAGSLPVGGLSIEIDRDFDAVGAAYLYDSCKISKLTLEQALEDALMATFDFVGREETEENPTEGLTYPSLRTFDWDQLEVTINGTPIDTESLEIVLDNALDNDAHKLGSRLRKHVLRKEPRKVSGKLECELDVPTFYNLFRDLTEFELVAIWTGATLGDDDGTPVYRKLTVTLPRCVFIGETPAVKDAGRIKLSLPFVAAATLDSEGSEIEAELVNSTLGA